MNDDLIDRQAAIKAIEDLQDCYNGFSDTYDKACIIGVLEELPSAQPESYKEKLKEIADALSEKFAYMNTCLNERDIILGYLGVKRPSKIHCNTDCINTKCVSHPLSSAQPELCTYKKYKGKPYYSIKYIENDETHIGYDTYNPKVLSQHLSEYFISSAQPTTKCIAEIKISKEDLEELVDKKIAEIKVAQERKKGKWVYTPTEPLGYVCSVCGKGYCRFNYCPNCGAEMRGETDEID